MPITRVACARLVAQTGPGASTDSILTKTASKKYSSTMAKSHERRKSGVKKKLSLKRPHNPRACSAKKPIRLAVLVKSAFVRPRAHRSNNRALAVHAYSACPCAACLPAMRSPRDHYGRRAHALAHCALRTSTLSSTVRTRSGLGCAHKKSHQSLLRRSSKVSFN